MVTDHATETMRANAAHECMVESEGTAEMEKYGNGQSARGVLEKSARVRHSEPGDTFRPRAHQESRNVPSINAMEFVPQSAISRNTTAYRLLLAHPVESLWTRISTLWSRSSRDEMIAGAEWYRSAVPSIIDDMATRYGVEYHTVAAIIAVFSPRTEWSLNVRNAETFLRAWSEGKRGKELPAVSMTFEPVRKAERIMLGADPEVTIVKRSSDNTQSWKTLCFYWNLCGDFDRVTIDVWMYRAFTEDDKTEYRPDGWYYLLLEEVIREFAASVGREPAMVQAILWTVIRGSAF